ncbi:MAG: peptide ABC transporter substrate-binding protein [Xanthomonadales bacterium]|nr:peptide ABC transporter substrate-binding protein [Gammaproteobacteria bacterium]MBT8053530.1 peptide ABC transporter substrate-binding protein [Gammaproteobacteria bacterium]NND57989.1 peptide ABC transporter substrate-binding protein [Xanthomonadales bacterium]NNK50845.1 peptide ABC transporter substrate-binding protein [Xanthomonadales bacterium]
MHATSLRICAFLISTLTLMLACQELAATDIRRGLGPEPDSLHIHQARGLAAVNLLRDLREGLLTFDQHGELAPGQAASWEELDDGRRYRFYLRSDARWSNGDPVTAADFVRAWHRAFTPETAAATAGLLKDVRNASEILKGNGEPAALGIVAVEPGVLDVLLTEPAPWLLEILAHPVSYPLHSKGQDDPLHAPVNGSFLLANWTPRASIRLERNPQFHGLDSVRVETVEYFPIEEPAAELSRYRAGELEITETIPAGRYDWLRENLAADLRVAPYLGTFWLGLNLKHQVLGYSTRLRQALSLAINRDILTATVLGAGELPAWSVVPPGIRGYSPSLMPQSEFSQAQREAEAVRLFELSGAGRPESLLLELRYNTSGVHRRVAVAVAAMWKQVLGVNTQLVNEEWKVFVNNRRLGVITEVFRGGWIADYADPSSFLDLFTGGNALNNTFYSNRDFDLLLKSTGRVSAGARMKLLQQAEAQLMQDMPVIPLYYYVSRHLVNPRITGFSDNVRDIHLSRYLGLISESR